MRGVYLRKLELYVATQLAATSQLMCEDIWAISYSEHYNKGVQVHNISKIKHEKSFSERILLILKI